MLAPAPRLGCSAPPPPGLCAHRLRPARPEPIAPLLDPPPDRPPGPGASGRSPLLAGLDRPAPNPAAVFPAPIGLETPAGEQARSRPLRALERPIPLGGGNAAQQQSAGPTPNYRDASAPGPD